jgi:hypothetical protein
MLAVRIPEHRRIYVAVDLCSVLVLCSIHSTACTNERTEAAWTGEGDRDPSRNQGKPRLIRAPSGLIDWPHPHHESAHSINPVPGMSTSGRPRNYFPVIATPAWPLTIIHHACIRSLASRTEGDEKDVCCMRPRPDPIHPPLSCPLMQLEPSSSTWPGSRQRKGKKRESSEKGGTSRSSNNLQSELVPLSPSLARLAFDQTVGQSSRSEKVAAYHAGRQR